MSLWNNATKPPRCISRLLSLQERIQKIVFFLGGGGTLDSSRRRRRSEAPKGLGGNFGEGILRTGGFEEHHELPKWGLGEAPAANDFWLLHTQFCSISFWNLAGKDNRYHPIGPLLPANGLEGARAPCAPFGSAPAAVS